MKNKFIIILALSLFYISCSAQKIDIKKISNSHIIEMLSNINEYTKFNGSMLKINIFAMNNGSGSAQLEESDEASFNYLITVNEFDENPNLNLYSIGAFINPKIISIKDLREKIILTIEAGTYSKRKIFRFAISIDKIESL